MKDIAAALLCRARTRSDARAERPVSLFEFWPCWLFYTPIIVQWVALGLRYGDFSLPTAANPRIPAGGLCGEKKSSYLDQVAPRARHWLAPYACFDTSDDPARDLPEALRVLAAAGLDYPLVAKPDIGCNGTGVRLIATEADLARYLPEFPRRAPLMLQAYVPYDAEAGL